MSSPCAPAPTPAPRRPAEPPPLSVACGPDEGPLGPPLPPWRVRRLLAEVAEPRLNPWWLSFPLVEGAIGLALRRAERVREPHLWAEFLSLRPGPVTDTFMARPFFAPEPAGPAEALLRAAVRARALAEALHALADAWPDQPLLRTVRTVHGRDRRLPLATSGLPPRIAVADGARTALVHAAGREPVELAAEIGASFAAGGTAPPGWLDAPGLVGVGRVGLREAWHRHRSAGREGPWLALSEADPGPGWGPLWVLSTRHLAVDGYGHAQLVLRIERAEQDLLRTLSRKAAAALTLRLGGRLPALADRDAERRVSGADPADPQAFLAWTPSPGPRFPAIARGFGVALHRFLVERGRARPDARFTPTFTVPRIPRRPDLPGDWRTRRVIPVLVSVRLERGRPEPVGAFAERLSRLVAGEAPGAELLADQIRKVCRAPIPEPWRPRASALIDRLATLDGPIRHISGHGMVSYVRLEAPAARGPLWGASHGTPLRSRFLDPGGPSMTVIDLADGTRSVGLTGCGLYAEPAALARFRELVEEEIARATAEGG